MAHNYQSLEVQDVADYVGDGLELAKKAVTVDADVIAVSYTHLTLPTKA